MQERELNLVFLVGAMKAGTSTLYADLNKHARVHGPPLKEPFFLVNGDSPNVVIQKYKNHFKQAMAESLLLDGSTGYTMLPDYPNAANVAVKIGIDPKIIIYLIREPFSRILSHFYHSVGSGDMNADFSSALRQDSRLINYSRYYFQIQPWLKAFGPDKVYVVTMDHWAQNRKKIAQAIFSLIGLKSALKEEDFVSVKNVRSRDRISPQLSRWLRNFFPRDTYRQVRSLIPSDIRQLLMKVLTKPSPTPVAEFSDYDLEYVWSHLEEELSLLAPYVRHPLLDPITIWNRNELFAQYRKVDASSKPY